MGFASRPIGQEGLGRHRFPGIAGCLLVLAAALFPAGHVAAGEGSVPADKGPAKLRAKVAADGALTLYSGKRVLGAFRGGLAEPGWRFAKASASARGAAPDSTIRPFAITMPSGGAMRGDVTFAIRSNDCEAVYSFIPAQDASLLSLHVAADFPIAALAGGKWTADEKTGIFPAEFKDLTLFAGPVKSLSLEFAGAGTLHLGFPSSTRVLLQDDRRWGATFTIRLLASGAEAKVFRKDEPVKLTCALSAEGGLPMSFDKPPVIAAGTEWIPVKLDLDIAPGSALDFSTQGFLDPPAGKLGRVVARPDGKFAFEKNPDTPRRFYGVNLCFSAQYLSHEEADRLAGRLSRLGYNAVRFHHYERDLILPNRPDSLTFNPENLDRLDYLAAALIRRGIYITTDLFTSRPVLPDEMGLPRDLAGWEKRQAGFKILVPVNDKAWGNWKAFARALLTHVNPHTGRAWGQEPGLAWISLINEGNLGNYLGNIREIPDWSAAWNRRLLRQYGTRDALATAWGTDLKSDEDPARGTVALPENLDGDTLRTRDAVLFLSEMERETAARMIAFLRKDLGVGALFTNMNGWSNRVTDQSARKLFDYVDDHFYVDHPQFLDKPWRLPSRCGNCGPAAEAATGGLRNSFTRLPGKPFTITEYNFSAPGRYRAAGGMLTGALGALQDWDAIWRFAYSHNRDNLFEPRPMGYFDVAADPINQAAERAALCLFLRGDLKPAPHETVVVMTAADLARPPDRIPRLAPAWTWAAWITRVGTKVVDNPAEKISGAVVLPVGWATPAAAYAGAGVAAGLNPYAASNAAVVAVLREHGILAAGNPTDPAAGLLRSETGEVTIDAPREAVLLDTPRTAGGFAVEGASLNASAGVTVAILETDATVWVSSLDRQPVASARRLLATHLTDVQNSGIRYAEEGRQTLLDWGRLPHLARAGKARIGVHVRDPKRFKVWALSTGGRRLAEVPTEVKDGALTFTADVAALAAQHGAIFCYELVAE